MKKISATKNQVATGTVAEIEASTPPAFTQPEFIRLPRVGEFCRWTGMSRGALNDLILPTKHNGGRPPVRSFCLRKPGAKTGVRMIDYASLRAHILRNVDTPTPTDTKEAAHAEAA